ncbi:ATP synthase subunit I [Trinickia sp. NRRL B-1857]|uniref:N-ATPase subunit AtpR n=1 Tax=Trinickia sp. NRRL B-1857 TaxID=3162879 RepID=UPI003D2CCE1A
MLLVPALSTSLKIAAGGMAGGIGGVAYFASLFANARCYARRAIGVAIVLQALRFGMLGLLLYGLAHLGPMALLSGLGGIVIARHVAVRFLGRTP